MIGWRGIPLIGCPCASPMHVGIRRILELLENQVAGIGRGQLLCASDRAGHAFGSRSQDKLGAECPQHLAPLDTHRVGHRDGQPVSLDRRDERQADPGVAAGRLQQDRVPRDAARAFGRFDHAEADPIFHACARVEALELRHDVGDAAVDDTVQPYHRRTANQLVDVGSNPAHLSSSKEKAGTLLPGFGSRARPGGLRGYDRQRGMTAGSRGPGGAGTGAMAAYS